MAALALLLVALALTCAAAQDSLPTLPLFKALPASCGRVEQVQSSDNCASMAARTNITMDTFSRLNPLLLCGDVPLQPGQFVCTGDTISFCNDVVVAAPGDTCKKIATNENGTVINVDGANSTDCSTLTSGVPVCVSPAPGKCAVSTLCGISIPPKMQAALAVYTDYCSIIAECQSPFAMGKNGENDVLTLSLNAVTPAMLAAKDKDGHPELARYMAKPAGSLMTVSFTADWFADGSTAIAIDPDGSARRLNRKLLYSQPIRTQGRGPIAQRY